LIYGLLKKFQEEKLKFINSGQYVAIHIKPLPTFTHKTAYFMQSKSWSSPFFKSSNKLNCGGIPVGYML
jgi:hypothetical protein